MAVPMANDPPFATLNHFAADLGIPSESDLLRIGIRPARRALPARDRGGQGPERIRFSSAILPPYARRSKSLEVLIPMLYLKGALHRTSRRHSSHCSARTQAGSRPR